MGPRLSARAVCCSNVWSKVETWTMWLGRRCPYPDHLFTKGSYGFQFLHANLAPEDSSKKTVMRGQTWSQVSDSSVALSSQGGFIFRSGPARGHLSSSPLGSCYPSSLSVSEDSSPCWVRTLPHSSQSKDLTHPLWKISVSSLHGFFGWKTKKSFLGSSKFSIAVTPNAK